MPAFTEHRHDAEGDDSVDQGPAGGRTWDGRAQSAHDQARLPLLSPREMANRTPYAVVAKLARASYAPAFRGAFGDHIFDDPAAAFDAALLALEVFQQSPADFYPYDSKYDTFLRGRAQLSPAEVRGLALFNDPARGNCASCHPSAMRSGAFPQFTDYGYIALGAPRNARIPANRNPGYFDLGMCGPERTDLSMRAEYCGMFRTPTLRNVATRQVFFHNGVFTSLEQVLMFYAERDIHPEKWFRRERNGGPGSVDLPARYQANLYREAPFDGRSGGKPLLSRSDIADIVAFLGTLTDGYSK